MTRAILDEDELDVIEAALIFYGSKLNRLAVARKKLNDPIVESTDPDKYEVLVTKALKKFSTMKKLSKHGKVVLEPMK